MLELFNHYADVTITESEDFALSLSPLVAKGNVLVVTSKGFSKRGVISEVADILGPLRTTIFDNIQPNPEKTELQQAFSQLSHGRFEHVVAIGGGSVIDTAKVLCALFSHPQAPLEELLSRGVVDNIVNFVAVPTTSGTGAEVTPFATVWQSDIAKKYSLYGIRPNTTLLDPSLTLSLPYKETLYPALDALSHALESLWNKNRTEQSEKYALSSIQLIFDNLNNVLDNPKDRVARKNLQRAATLAGMAISITKTAIAHAISYPLTLQYGIPHGLACSFTLTAIIMEISGEQLNLSAELADKISVMLDSFNLPQEVRQYVSPSKLLEEIDAELEPSRAANYVGEINEKLLRRILSTSLRMTKGGKNED